MRNNNINAMPTKSVSDDLSVSGSRPASARGVSGAQAGNQPATPLATRSKRNSYKKVGETSYVDELLFGRPIAETSFEAPWGEQKDLRSARPLLWSPPSTGTGVNPRVRPKSSPRNQKKFRMTAHKDSYVDETLFGPAPVYCGWEAPWGERSPKTRPFLFSPTDYRVKKGWGSSAAGEVGPTATKQIPPQGMQRSKLDTALQIPEHSGADYWQRPAAPSSARSTARETKPALKPWR
ncbi:RBPJ-interacting and tubulin-associated protein 1-like [Tubulanus polymorphus]|uniref:RBPJ-interacting and tubulin-associated protein 1-like n=1 Tax=Tubulanus polymorphus TaxID=672921 RepID=UPI003DA4B75F